MKTVIAAIMMVFASSAMACDAVPAKSSAEVKAELAAFKKAFPLSGLTESGYPGDSMPAFVSTKTRAEVKAELEAFKKAYPFANDQLAYPATVQPKDVSTKTRSEVKAELKDAKAKGEVSFGELDYPVQLGCK